MFKIAVSYDEDVDAVIEILNKLGRELREDLQFGRLILQDPEMLGVDAFDPASVTIKFLLKTKPLQQWPVKRELLRRIKKRFDELNISMLGSHHATHAHDCHEPTAA